LKSYRKKTNRPGNRAGGLYRHWRFTALAYALITALIYAPMRGMRVGRGNHARQHSLLGRAFYLQLASWHLVAKLASSLVYWSF
jgi:hypothetical protein